MVDALVEDEDGLEENVESYRTYSNSPVMRLSKMKLLVTPAHWVSLQTLPYCIMRNKLYERSCNLQCALATAALNSSTVVALMMSSALRYTVQIPN